MNGQLMFLVTVKMEHKLTDELTTMQLIMMANDDAELNSRFSYQVDVSDYKNIIMTSVQKIKNKIHLLSTHTEKLKDRGISIERNDGTVKINQNNSNSSSVEYVPKIFAIGLTTSVVAADEKHALRKVGNYLHLANTAGGEKTTSPLSSDTKLIIDECHKKSGYAMPRDVFNERNSASFVRG